MSPRKGEAERERERGKHTEIFVLFYYYYTDIEIEGGDVSNCFLLYTCNSSKLPYIVSILPRFIHRFPREISQ